MAKKSHWERAVHELNDDDKVKDAVLDMVEAGKMGMSKFGTRHRIDGHDAAPLPLLLPPLQKMRQRRRPGRLPKVRQRQSRRRVRRRQTGQSQAGAKS